MSEQRAAVKNLMADLAHLSGLAEAVIGEEVDWFEADLASITGDDIPLAETGPHAKLAARRETLKGELEMLAKRMAGVVEFVEDGKPKQAVVSLEKILLDGQLILERLPGSKNVKPPKKQEEPDKEDLPTDKGGEPKGPVAPSGGAGQEAGATESEAVFIDGYLITEEERKDPFGFGVGLVNSVLGLLGKGDK